MRIFVILLTILPLAAPAAVWPDSVDLAGRRWPVTAQWRGQKQAVSPDWAPADLRPLPDSLCAGHRSAYLRSGTLVSLEAMAAAAARDSIQLRVNSGYRSAATQARLIEKRLDHGRRFEEILWGVAPPGYSEHMLGTTVDFALGAGEKRAATHAWLEKNAWRWGFAESYPKDPTGRFPHEPWHWRCWDASPPREETHARP